MNSSYKTQITLVIIILFILTGVGGFYGYTYWQSMQINTQVITENQPKFVYQLPDYDTPWQISDEKENRLLDSSILQADLLYTQYREGNSEVTQSLIRHNMNTGQEEVLVSGIMSQAKLSPDKTQVAIIKSNTLGIFSLVDKVEKLIPDVNSSEDSPFEVIGMQWSYDNRFISLDLRDFTNGLTKTAIVDTQNGQYRYFNQTVLAWAKTSNRFIWEDPEQGVFYIKDEYSDNDFTKDENSKVLDKGGVALAFRNIYFGQDDKTLIAGEALYEEGGEDYGMQVPTYYDWHKIPITESELRAIKNNRITKELNSSVGWHSSDGSLLVPASFYTKQKLMYPVLYQINPEGEMKEYLYAPKEYLFIETKDQQENFMLVNLLVPNTGAGETIQKQSIHLLDLDSQKVEFALINSTGQGNSLGGVSISEYTVLGIIKR